MMQNILFTPLFLASSNTSDLFLTFSRFHAEIFSSFSHSLSTAAFAANIFIAWGIGKHLCQIVMLQWITPISCNMVFMNSWCNSFHTQSLGFHCFQDTRKFWLVIIILATGGPVPAICPFSRLARAAGTSNFCPAFLMISLNSISSGSMKWIPLSLLAFSRFGFSPAKFCFSFNFWVPWHTFQYF